LKLRNMPPPDWRTWKHVAKLSAEEAAALTMNFCPNTIKKILAEVSESGSPALFPLVAGASGMDYEDATEFDNRLLILERSFETGPATVDLATLAKRFDWSIPDVLANLAATASSEAEPKPADETLSDNERTKLLKHIGALALLVAEHKSIYRKAPDKVGNWLPNASRIARGVVDHIAELPGREGAGNSSLRDSIKAGVDLLNKVT
jgi:hypothetical protein